MAELAPGQDTYMPPPGTRKQCFCGVCGEEMLVTRDVNGPTNFVSAIVHASRHHDFFHCPHRDEEWHKQVKELFRLAKTTPSPSLREIYVKDIEQLLEDRK